MTYPALQRQLSDLRLLRSSLRDAHRRAAGVDAESIEHVEKALRSTERRIDQVERDLGRAADPPGAVERALERMTA